MATLSSLTLTLRGANPSLLLTFNEALSDLRTDFDVSIFDASTAGRSTVITIPAQTPASASTTLTHNLSEQEQDDLKLTLQAGTTAWFTTPAVAAADAIFATTNGITAVATRTATLFGAARNDNVAPTIDNDPRWTFDLGSDTSSAQGALLTITFDEPVDVSSFDRAALRMRTTDAGGAAVASVTTDTLANATFAVDSNATDSRTLTVRVTNQGLINLGFEAGTRTGATSASESAFGRISGVELYTDTTDALIADMAANDLAAIATGSALEGVIITQRGPARSAAGLAVAGGKLPGTNRKMPKGGYFKRIQSRSGR